MDILTGERPAKLEYRYLRATDQERLDHDGSVEADEDLFHVEVRVVLQSTDTIL